MLRKSMLFMALLITYCEKPPESMVVAAESPRKTYFIVTTKDGLNLRKDPGTNAKVIAVLPFKFRGEILEKQNKYESIQNANGYWAKVRYKNQTGWIFSGFIWLLDSIDEFVNIPDNEEQELNIAEPMTEKDINEVKIFDLKRYKKLIDQALGLNEYEVFLEKYAPDQECEGVGLLIVAKNRKRAFWTKVSKSDFKLISSATARALMFFDVFGHCGCGAHLVLRIIFQGEKGLKSLSIDPPNSMKPGDSCAMFDAHTPAKNEVKYNISNNTLLVHSKTLSCRPTQAGTPEGKVTRFHSGFFRVYDFSGASGRRILEQAKDEVPNLYKTEWQALPPL